MVQMLSNKDPRLCDCNRIVDADAIPLPGPPDKQKEISIKADWKYVGVATYHLNNLLVANNQPSIVHPSLFIPGQHLQDIFRPPRI
jgi:hypothetical protein